VIPFIIAKQSPRVTRLKAFSEIHGLTFKYRPEQNFEDFESFYFFKSRPMERISNGIYGSNNGLQWQINDVVFDEGAFMSTEEYRTTVGLIRVPIGLPKFTIEKRSFLEKLIPSHKDIDYLIYKDFSKDFLVKAESISEMSEFLTPEITNILTHSEDYHLECN
jgi:carbonic anhydrase